MLTLIGLIPYAILGALLSSMEYGYNTWQFYAVTACAIVGDVITMLKYSR